MASEMGAWFDALAINRKIRELDGRSQTKYSRFCRIAATMQEHLDAQQWFLPIAYTPHDFSHHVKQVMINASHLLKHDLDQFSIDELLALQYACLLHDIDMAYNPYQRMIHGYNGAYILSPYATALTDETIRKKLEDEFRDHNVSLSALKDSFGLPSEEIKESICAISETVSQTINFLLNDEQLAEAISRIILGHSDIKIDPVCRIKTLDKVFYDDLKLPLGIEQKRITFRRLAAILRLADELDCSRQRIEGILITNGYSMDSQRHWEKLKIIQSVEINNRRITLHVDGHIKDYSKKPHDLFDLLSEIENKVRQEYDVVSACMREENQSIVYDLQPFEWPTNDNRQEDYESYKKRQAQKKQREQQRSLYGINGLIKLIKSTIDEQGLYREVHQSLADGKCIRNHLDCNGLLTKHQVVDGVAQVFVNAIFTGSFDTAPESIPENNYVLLGVANSGALIASKISTITGIPFVYYVPPHKEKAYSDPEKSLGKYADIFVDKEIIVVIGVNHTGAAIASAIEELNRLKNDENINLKIKKVLGIINRDCAGSDSGNGNQVHDGSVPLEQNSGRIVPESTEYLMVDYPIEICSINADSNRKCPYGKKCLNGEED